MTTRPPLLEAFAAGRFPTLLDTSLDTSVRFLAGQFADSIPHVELSAEGVENWLTLAVGELFMPTIVGDDPAMLWVEYRWPYGKGPERKAPTVFKARRIGVAFIVGRGMDLAAWHTERLNLNLLESGSDPGAVARTVLALVVGWIAEEETAVVIASMAVAFNAKGTEAANAWMVLSAPQGDIHDALLDAQIASQGMPGAIFVTAPAWQALAAIMKKRAQ